MSKWIRWVYILNKRLYKRVSFLAILGILFASVCLFALASRGDSGFVHIVLAQVDSDDNMSSQITESLLKEDSMILFTKADSPDSAIEAVKSGVADAAWILPDNMQEKVADYPQTKTAFVRVVEREQTVFLRLSREKLHSVLYDYCAKALFLHYTHENLAELSHLSDEELLNSFNSTMATDTLFVFDNPVHGTSNTSINYLTSPLRGLLGVITLLSGMAAILYYLQDEQNKTYAWMPQNTKPFVVIACAIVATLNTIIISTASLWISGLYRVTVKEGIVAICYAVCCVAFCTLLKYLFDNIKIFAALIPALTAVITCTCPIFFNNKLLEPLSLLFPPTYYIKATYNNEYLLYMLLYSAVCLALCFFLHKIPKMHI